MKRVFITTCLLAILQYCLASYSESNPFSKTYRHLILTAQCDFKCGQCQSATPAICTSCNTSSNRSLVGTTCVCNESFLEINEPICAACPTNCKKCSSLNKCDICNTGTYTYKGLCYAKCPDNTYLIPSTYVCVDYLSYNINEERDKYNRIMLTFQFNYDIKTISNPTSLITMKIKEDYDASVISIMPQISTSQSQLKFLILPRTSVGSSTLMIVSYNTVDLISKASSIPIVQVDPNNLIHYPLGAYLIPESQSSQDGLRNSSDFLYNKSEVSYDVFYVLRCMAIFVHIFPALQFIMALCYMEVFRTPLFYYFIKLLGGFGINQLPDWQLKEGQSGVEKFGDDKMPFLYYVIQLLAIYIVYGIMKWVYETSKKEEVDHISRFETILKVHIWTISILQYIHSVLLFYLVYYSIFILKQADFSSSKNIFFFVLALIILFYIVLYIVLGSYRLAINSFHFFICYVKEIEDNSLPTRFYLFGVGNAKKILFIIFLCALYSEKQIAMAALAFVIYTLAFIYTIIYRPYESISLLVIKIIEELSQVGLFATILAGQVTYDNESLQISSDDTYYSIDYACLAFIGVFLLMNIFKQLTALKHLIYKNETTKRTITYMHKFDDHYQDPISVNRNKQGLIDKNSFLDNYNAVNMSQQTINKQQLLQSSRKMAQSQRGNQQNNDSQNQSIHQFDNYQQNMQIEMNNMKNVQQNTNQSQKMAVSKNQMNTNQRESIDDKNKFQKAVEKTKIQNQAASQFQQAHQQSHQSYQSNAFTNAYNNNNNNSNKKNMQANPFKKTENGYMLQYTLRDLYGNQNNQNMFNNKGNQYPNPYNSRKKPTPSIGMIQEQRRMQQAAEQINGYFNGAYKKGDTNHYSQNRNNMQNFESIEKNNFQSNQQQQNQANHSFVFVNPYLQNSQKPNLDNISEEDFRNSVNAQQSDVYQNYKQQRMGNNDLREQNSEQHIDTKGIHQDYNQHGDYEEIDQEHYSQSPTRNQNSKNSNRQNGQQINNEEDQQQYLGGESINLQDYDGDKKEKELKEYLKQSIKSKTINLQNEGTNNNNNNNYNSNNNNNNNNINDRPTSKSPNPNQENNFQVFFHNKMKDNSIQYIQEESSDQNNSQQHINLFNNQNRSKKTSNNGNYQINPNEIPKFDNYLSPEFKQAAQQAQNQQPFFKTTTKATVKQNNEPNQYDEEYY